MLLNGKRSPFQIRVQVLLHLQATSRVHLEPTVGLDCANRVQGKDLPDKRRRRRQYVIQLAYC